MEWTNRRTTALRYRQYSVLNHLLNLLPHSLLFLTVRWSRHAFRFRRVTRISVFLQMIKLPTKDGKATAAATAARTHAVAAIKNWTEAALPSHLKEEAVMVSELKCSEPGCPPVETAVSVLRKQRPLLFKVHKPVGEVSQEELLAEIQKAMQKDVEGVYNFALEGRECEVHLRPLGRFHAPKFQAKSRWTVTTAQDAPLSLRIECARALAAKDVAPLPWPRYHHSDPFVWLPRSLSQADVPPIRPKSSVSPESFSCSPKTTWFYPCDTFIICERCGVFHVVRETCACHKSSPQFPLPTFGTSSPFSLVCQQAKFGQHERSKTMPCSPPTHPIQPRCRWEEYGQFELTLTSADTQCFRGSKVCAA